MEAVTLSPKFQVVIPKKVREKMHLKAGTKFHVLSFQDRIELIPVKPLAKMKGFLKGFDPHFEREKEDRY